MRIPDGIVVAADSLSTAQTMLQVGAQLKMKCPKCDSEIEPKELKLPPVSIPFNASSYTQKVFPFARRYAITTYGQGIVNERSVYYHLMQFERDSEHQRQEWTVTDLVDKISNYFQQQLELEFPKYSTEAPDDWLPLGFHVSGYEKVENKDVAATYILRLGKNSKTERLESIGCTIGGDLKVVQKFWEIGEEEPRNQFRYLLYSLQDAIDFVEFLINTTSDFQRFANEVSTVGGEVDIGLVTPFHGFTWIKRKHLMDVLEGEGRDERDS